MSVEKEETESRRKRRNRCANATASKTTTATATTATNSRLVDFDDAVVEPDLGIRGPSTGGAVGVPQVIGF